jgi:aryl-alcohol dehydrogenase-like predicted oxidoreductase
MLKKITIGCANIGYTYGLDSIKIKKSEVKKIFNFCNENKINCFDTADVYKNSYNILKENKFNIKVDTKVFLDNDWKNYEYCKKHLLKIKKSLGFKNIDTLYIHNPKFLINNRSKKLVLNLSRLKTEGFFKKTGISIYTYDTLYRDLKKFKFDAVQCPLNVFDQRLINKGHLDKLKKMNIKVHVRSIFLQGVLLNENMKKKKKLRQFSKQLNHYFNFIKLNNIKPLEFCLNYVLNVKKIDKFIIGINSKNHLKEIINFKANKKYNYDLFDYSHKQNLLDPGLW